MELFDKKYVYCTWDDELAGKQVFVAETISTLKEAVDGDCAALRATVIYSDNEDVPFESITHGTTWRYVYYDPNYGIKVAHAQGKQIQMLKVNGDWFDVFDPSWDDVVEYRIKPEEPKPEKEFKLGDKVTTPAGREAIIVGIERGDDIVLYHVAGAWLSSKALEAME